jgi:hypothetical protein
VLNGYSDWFLPSKDELNLLYQQKTSVGGLSSDYYWSSSEYYSSSAWLQHFLTGIQGNGGKTNGNHIRAIRSF